MAGHVDHGSSHGSKKRKSKRAQGGAGFLKRNRKRDARTARIQRDRRLEPRR